MRAQRFYLALQLMAACLSSAATAEVDRTTPEKTLESFTKCVEARDYNGLLSCVKGAKKHYLTESIFAPQAKAFTITFKVDKLEVGKTKASILARVYMAANGNTAIGRDTINFAKESDLWLILPERVASEGDRYISQLVQMLSEPDQIFSNAKAAAIERTCKDKMREVAIGMILLVNKNRGVLKLSADSWQKTVAPYIKNGSDFCCPYRKDGTVNYSFNQYLAGKSLVKVKDVARTILLYEGKNGKLEYRHGGKATVALADGAIVSVTPEEAKKLKWK